jgi:hypothetical protein
LSLILGELKQAKIEKVTSLPTDSKEYRIVGYDGDIYFYDTSSYRKVIKEDSSPYFQNINAYGDVAVTGSGVIAGRNIGTDGDTLDFLVSVSGNAAAAQTNLSNHEAATGSSAHQLGTASIHDFEDFQEPLSSGVNIKTINNQSIVGTGNLTVTGEPGTYDHSELTNLAFADSGHTGFEEAGAATGAVSTHAALTGNSVHGLGTASIHDFGDFEEAGVVATHAALTGENVHGLGTLGTKTYWLGSQATYDGLGSYDGNTVYFIEE